MCVCVCVCVCPCVNCTYVCYIEYSVIFSCTKYYHLSPMKLNETIVIELFDEDNSKGLIAEPSSVNVTILENDDPYGVFMFASTSLSVAIG